MQSLPADYSTGRYMSTSQQKRPDDADIAKAEAARVATVRASIQHDRIEALERERLMLRAINAQLLQTTANAREAGRCEALEIIARLDPKRLMDLHVHITDGPNGQEHKWSREGLAALLGVSTDNPMSRVLESLESGYWDTASRLMDANLRIRDLQRQLEIAQAQTSPAETQPVQKSSQREPSDGIRKRMQGR